jgi:Protein of unknown function (DUF2786)
MLSQKELDRLKKILALKASPNEAEAEAAARMATEILARHNLSIGDINLKDQPIEDQLIGDRLSARSAKWRRVLLTWVAHSTGCQALVQQWQVGNRSYEYQQAIIGSEAGLIVCTQLYNYLEGAIEALADLSIAEARSQGRQPVRNYRKNFCEGAAVRIAKRLIAEDDRRRAEGLTFEDGTTAPAGAIVLSSAANDQALEKYSADRGIRDVAGRLDFSPDRPGFVEGAEAEAAIAIGINPQLQEVS